MTVRHCILPTGLLGVDVNNLDWTKTALNKAAKLKTEFDPTYTTKVERPHLINAKVLDLQACIAYVKDLPDDSSSKHKSLCLILPSRRSSPFTLKEFAVILQSMIGNHGDHVIVGLQRR